MKKPSPKMYSKIVYAKKKLQTNYNYKQHYSGIKKLSLLGLKHRIFR